MLQRFWSLLRWVLITAQMVQMHLDSGESFQKGNGGCWFTVNLVWVLWMSLKNREPHMQWFAYNYLLTCGVCSVWSTWIAVIYIYFCVCDEIYCWMFSELGTNPSEWQEILAACKLNLSNPLEVPAVCRLPGFCCKKRTPWNTFFICAIGSKSPLFPCSRGWSSTLFRRGLYTHYKDSRHSRWEVSHPQYNEFRPWHICGWLLSNHTPTVDSLMRKLAEWRFLWHVFFFKWSLRTQGPSNGGVWTCIAGGSSK